MQSNRSLMIIIIVLLLGIGGYMVYEHNNRPQTLGESIDEAVEEIGDEIDDATTAR